MNIDCKQTPGERHLGGCERRDPPPPQPAGQGAGGARSPAAGKHACTCTSLRPPTPPPEGRRSVLQSQGQPRPPTTREGTGGPCSPCPAEGSGLAVALPPAPPRSGPPPCTCRRPGRRQLSLYSWWVIMGLSPGGEDHKRNMFHLQVSPSWPPTLVLIPFLERGCIYPRPKSSLSLQNPHAFPI